MRVLENIKSNVGGNRLGTTLKAQPQPGLNDLRKNLPERRDLVAYVRQLVTTVGPLMETASSVGEQGPATVTSWYTVDLTKCAGMSESAIRMALRWVVVPLQVEIFNFKRSGPADNDDGCRFFVDSLLLANRLRRLQDKAMEIYTCRPIKVQVSVGLSLWNTEFSADFEKAVEAALHGRYDPATGTLNLCRLHADINLANHFCPLHVMKILEGVLMLARRHLQLALTGIVLANNYLCSLKAFAGITAADFSALERLDISANKINDLGELKYLSQLSIKTLVLTGNEVAKLKSDDIRAVLPQLKDIHGCVQSKSKVRVMDNLPKFQKLQSGGAGSDALEFAQRFVGCYYASFDDPAQRQQLTHLYDPQPAFSVSVPKQLDHVKVYGLYNRNHQSLHSPFARNAKLQVGTLALIQALERFPRMQTAIKRAKVDILVFTARLRILTLTGFFKEQSWSPLGWEERLFQRTFVLRRTEGQTGWLIANDMLSIISPWGKQEGSIHVRPIKQEVPDVIYILDDEEESTTDHNSSPELVIDREVSVIDISDDEEESTTDPVEQAVRELSLTLPKMAIVTEEREVEMPPIIEAQPLMEMPPLVPATRIIPDCDEQAVRELSLTLPKMAIVTEVREVEMPPIIEAQPLMEMPPLPATRLIPDSDEELDHEIDSVLSTEDTLIIDEEELLGDI